MLALYHASRSKGLRGSNILKPDGVIVGQHHAI